MLRRLIRWLFALLDPADPGPGAYARPPEDLADSGELAEEEWRRRRGRDRE
jgi:hypothetical protein